MTLQETVFIGIAALTLLGAWMAVWLRNVFYNALALIASLFGVACLFIYLNSEFLAVMEVIIYIGAISIAIIFAIMLSRPMFHKDSPRSLPKIIRSFVAAVLLFIGLAKLIRSAHWPAGPSEGDYSIRAIGTSLLTTQVIAFEAVSLILLIAIIGALVISNRKGPSA